MGYQSPGSESSSSDGGSTQMTVSVRSACENHYPIPVMTRTHDGVADLNQRLFAEIEAMEKAFRDTPDNAVLGGEISTQGGYQTSTRENLFLRKSNAIEEFVQQVLNPGIREYLRELFGDEAERLTPWPVGWANLLDPGDWQGPHNHPTADNVASGVYYVALPGERPNPEGRIEFLNPIPNSIYHGYSPSRRLHPKEGMMLMFPPYYVHYVHPFKGDGRRAIIAFDILSRKPGLNFVF